MAKDKHEHVWVEQGRYLPTHPRDFDAAANLPEERRDADGKPEAYDLEGWEAPKPYVFWDCQDPDCPEVKRVDVPKAAYDRIVAALDDGSLKPEHLSQLPLGELIPELAEHQGIGSGAARVAFATAPAGGKAASDDGKGA
jgi:hypothetical protein